MEQEVRDLIPVSPKKLHDIWVFHLNEEMSKNGVITRSAAKTGPRSAARFVINVVLIFFLKLIRLFKTFFAL